MSPELERLLEAYDQKQNSTTNDQFQRDASFERLLSDALARRNGTTDEQLLSALRDHYQEFLRVRRKPSSLPPEA